MKTVTLEATPSEVGKVRFYRDDVMINEATVAALGPVTYVDSPPDGAYSYSATSVDLAGNESLRSVSVPVDLGAPMPPGFRVVAITLVP